MKFQRETAMIRPRNGYNQYYLAMDSTFFEAKLKRPRPCRPRPNARGRGGGWGQLVDSRPSPRPRRSNRSRVAVVTYYITRFDGSNTSPITDTAELEIQEWESGRPTPVQVQN